VRVTKHTHLDFFFAALLPAGAGRAPNPTAPNAVAAPNAGAAAAAPPNPNPPAAGAAGAAAPKPPPNPAPVLQNVLKHQHYSGVQL